MAQSPHIGDSDLAKRKGQKNITKVVFAIRSLFVVFRYNILFLVHIKSVQLTIESSHNTTNTPNSLISAQNFSITNTIVLHRFPHFTLHITMERMFEDDDDLYVEDFDENDDSDDIYSDPVVDEVNENEADDADDDHAGTDSV